MSRADAPFGFRPVRRLNGGELSYGTYYVTGSNSALYIGDPVILTSTGNASALTAVGAGTFPIGTLQGVTLATAGATNKLLGFVTAIYATTRDSTPYRENATDRVVQVCDDPLAIYEAQADAAVAVTSIGLNSNVVLDTAGSAVTGISGAEIDATAAADATYQLTLMGLRRLPGSENVINTAGNVFECMINLHQRTTGVGQAGV